MAVNVPLVTISQLTEQTSASDTDNLVIGGTDAKRITLPNIAKAILAKAAGAVSTIMASDLDVNRALISNGSGKVAASSITASELECLDNAKSNIQTQIDTLNSNIDELKWFKYFDGSKALNTQDPWNSNYGFNSFDVIMMSVYLPSNQYETFYFFTYATDTSHIIPIATSNNELGYIGFKTNGRFLENPKAMLLSGSAWKDITANVVVGSIKAGRMLSAENAHPNV